MKHITDDDLVLLYYGDHENAELAAEVARSPELSKRFDALSERLALIDEWTPPARDQDYGPDVWRKIESRLEPARQAPGRPRDSWIARLMQPRFSLAGALSLVLVASVAFMLGRQAGQPVDPAPAAGSPLQVVDTPAIGSARLLTESVSSHLDQLNLALTQFANDPQRSMVGAEWATEMLVANRLYRNVAEDRGAQQLARFLAELEPLLIELAYGAHQASPETLSRMQQEVRDGLLFRVRIMNQQLKQPQIST